jgi:hypothetical protein
MAAGKGFSCSQVVAISMTAAALLGRPSSTLVYMAVVPCADDCVALCWSTLVAYIHILMQQ